GDRARNPVSDGRNDPPRERNAAYAATAAVAPCLDDVDAALHLGDEAWNVCRRVGQIAVHEECVVEALGMRRVDPGPERGAIAAVELVRDDIEARLGRGKATN